MPDLTPIGRARQMFAMCRRRCTCGCLDDGFSMIHGDRCGNPTLEDVAAAIREAVLAERATCIDIIRSYAQTCGCSRVIEAAIRADAEGHGLTHAEERAARWGEPEEAHDIRKG